jgi:hypothetical protein
MVQQNFIVSEFSYDIGLAPGDLCSPFNLILLFIACSDNLQLLRQRYYYATWKADGTRYMMLIMRDGCFLIDRNFCFRRVQMRFPRRNFNEVKFFLCWRNNCGAFLL